MSALIEEAGFTVRREKLSRGPAYKVRSAGCLFSGDKVLFVDRNLPEDQQVGLLINYLLELGLTPSEELLSLLSPANQDMLKSQDLRKSRKVA